MAGATQSYVGSTKAHQDIFRDRIKVYREYIENAMNEEIIPRLVAMGYIDDGLEFKYSGGLEMSVDSKIDLYDFLSDKYEIEPEEIAKDSIKYFIFCFISYLNISNWPSRNWIKNIWSTEIYTTSERN